MIVDLERNDLGRICEPGSVGWPELMRVRPMAGVEHLVSLVEGRLRAGRHLAEVLSARCSPADSVTGAPKVAALDHIARARAGRPRRLDGRPRHGLARTATSTSR